ncbi:MAG: hypothetical protein JW965_07740 [Bacteroidales bacterium]|nr:hypothetical protein [Bacteroidales bacterium]
MQEYIHNSIDVKEQDKQVTKTDKVMDCSKFGVEYINGNHKVGIYLVQYVDKAGKCYNAT